MSLFLKVAKTVPIVIKDPKHAIPMIWRHLFPFGIAPKDPQAYRIGSWGYGCLPRLPISEVFPGIQTIGVTTLRAFDRTENVSMDPLEVLLLGSIVKFVQPKRILEIGTFDGNTTLNLAANSPPDGSVVTVDLPPDWDKRKFAIKVPEAHLNINDPAVTGAQYRSSEYAAKITQVFGDSIQLNWGTLPIPFDLVFIDGCHSYDYVKQDTSNAMKNCSPGGLVVWHDYGMLEDVSRLVDETAQVITIRALQGTRLAVGFMPVTQRSNNREGAAT